MILSTLVTSQLHFEMCAGLYGHPVYIYIYIYSNNSKATAVTIHQANQSQ